MLANAAFQLEKNKDLPHHPQAPYRQKFKRGLNGKREESFEEIDEMEAVTFEPEGERPSYPTGSRLRTMARAGEEDERKWTTIQRTLLFSLENPLLVIIMGLLTWILVGGVLMQKLILASCLPWDITQCPEPSYAEGIYYGVQAGEKEKN
jgi:hypothetical protein